MKRIFSVIAAIAIAGLAALCVYCVASGVASDANKAASIYAPDSNAVEMMEEQESVKFSSLQAYIDYMTGGNGAASANSIQQSSGYYYVPANLPEDITVTSVEIVEDGTVFTYNVAREVLIDVALTDSDMRELFSTMKTKVYFTAPGEPQSLKTDTGKSRITSFKTRSCFKRDPSDTVEIVFSPCMCIRFGQNNTPRNTPCSSCFGIDIIAFDIP